MANKKTVSINFEKSLEDLNKLVSQMEHGSLSLEQSLQHFEKGIHIIRECQQALQTAEQKVQILTQEGTHALQSFTLEKDKTHD